MERLTYRDENGKAWANIKNNYTAREAQEFGRIALEQLAAYEDSGLSPAEVQELSKAKEEGRLVVLPCKVGDNVYFLLQEIDDEWYISNPHSVTEVGSRGFWTSAFPLEKPNAMDDFTSWDDFGKTVFLTYEEAQKVLERSGQDGSR